MSASSSGWTTARQGTVVSYDAGVGLGTIRAEDGTEVGFHCTAIADGSRDIAEGTVVRFGLAAGRGGRWEATGVEPG